jgi:hypothetical protein
MNAKNLGPVKKNNKTSCFGQLMRLCINCKASILQEIQGVYYIFTKSIGPKTFVWARGFPKIELFINAVIQKISQVFDFNNLFNDNSLYLLSKKPVIRARTSIFCTATHQIDFLLRRIRPNCDLVSSVFTLTRAPIVSKKTALGAYQDWDLRLKPTLTPIGMRDPQWQYPRNQVSANSIKFIKINGLIKYRRIQSRLMSCESSI